MSNIFTPNEIYAPVGMTKSRFQYLARLGYVQPDLKNSDSRQITRLFSKDVAVKVALLHVYEELGHPTECADIMAAMTVALLPPIFKTQNIEKHFIVLDVGLPRLTLTTAKEFDDTTGTLYGEIVDIDVFGDILRAPKVKFKDFSGYDTRFIRIDNVATSTCLKLGLSKEHFPMMKFNEQGALYNKLQSKIGKVKASMYYKERLALYREMNEQE